MALYLQPRFSSSIPSHGRYQPLPKLLIIWEFQFPRYHKIRYNLLLIYHCPHYLGADLHAKHSTTPDLIR